MRKRQKKKQDKLNNFASKKSQKERKFSELWWVSGGYVWKKNFMWKFSDLYFDIRYTSSSSNTNTQTEESESNAYGFFIVYRYISFSFVINFSDMYHWTDAEINVKS